jgi:indole-3-acetate monooxygenase
VADQQAFLERVADMAGVVAAEAEQADQDRRLGPGTVEALRSSGLTRMLLPARDGGGDAHLKDTFPVLEALARVNGSAGWNLGITATSAAIAGEIADDGARAQVMGDERAIVAGTINFFSIACRRVDGGYAFDGPATFLSGSSHAEWLVIGGWLQEGGAPAFTEAGMPHIVRGVIPMDAVELSDTWHVSGMRATASNDTVLDGQYVPDAFLCAPDGVGLVPGDPAAQLPLFSRFGAGLSWVGLGCARGALDAFRAVAGDHHPVASAEPLAERADTQAAVAQATGMVEAGAAFLSETWAAGEAKVLAGEPLDAHDQAMLRLSYVTGAEYAARATDLLVRAAGSSSLYERNGIERCWRDANAVTKHITVSARSYERVGRILLGLPPLPGPI